MSKAIEELIMLSDILDVNGFSDHANTIDLIIKEAGSSSRPVHDFVAALKEAFTSVSKLDSFSSINNKSIDEIFRVMDYVFDKGSFLGPQTSKEEQIEIDDPINKLILGISQYESEINRTKEEINKVDDPENQRSLSMDLNDDISRLQELYDEVDKMRIGNREADESGESDIEKYDRFLKKFKEYTGREYRT